MGYVIEAVELRKYFVKKEDGVKRRIAALDGLSLTVEEGEFFGLLGPNGAGKTTFTKVLCTLVIPDSGTARVNGYDVVREASKVRRSIGWLHGETGGRALYWRLSGRDNLRFYAYLQNVPSDVAEKRIKALLEFFELEDDADRLVKDYSTGMKVKLMLARTLIHSPPILLLDEPTVGLDPPSARETRLLLKDINRELGTTILFTSHNLNEVEELCERVAIIHRGRIIAEGPPIEISMKIRSRMEVEFEYKGPEGVLDEVSKLPSVKAMRVLSQSDVTRAVAEVTSENEAMCEIAKAVVSAGGELLSVKRRVPSLEEAFIAITEGGQLEEG
ncbi:MAG: ABC transporter ATP-binding protein [Thermoproteota archaeon]|nr:MAG: ABC transporter ATP-binding protein [Candidatus Korarchaeota archaeon]